ncbi:MAG: CRISPR-associated endonuclease Cas6 [Candidatus Hodarchaeales archaeon]
MSDNQLKINMITLRFKAAVPVRNPSAAKLRGFFATAFNENKLFHQHSGEGYVFKYPLIQYKILGSTYTVIAINEAVDVLEGSFTSLKEIRLGNIVCPITDKYVVKNEYRLGITEGLQDYKFITPWFALNQKNYVFYRSLVTSQEKKEFLSRILIGNILSLCKSLGLRVEQKIMCTVSASPRRSSMKTVPIMPFIGQFRTNFEIPDLLGLGKSVSRGFGTIQKVDGQDATCS